MNELIIKPVTEKDSALLRHLAVNCPPLDVHTPYTYWVVANFFGEYSFIAYDKEKPVGYIMCIVKDDMLFVWQIGIVADYRCKNYSSLLLKAVFDKALESKIGTISVTIAKENTASYNAFFAFCKRNGYSIQRYKNVKISDIDVPSFNEEEIMYLIKKN